MFKAVAVRVSQPASNHWGFGSILITLSIPPVHSMFRVLPHLRCRCVYPIPTAVLRLEEFLVPTRLTPAVLKAGGVSKRSTDLQRCALASNVLRGAGFRSRSVRLFKRPLTRWTRRCRAANPPQQDQRRCPKGADGGHACGRTDVPDFKPTLEEDASRLSGRHAPTGHQTSFSRKNATVRPHASSAAASS